MQILALNSSPRDNDTSKTEMVLQKFLEGARRAGAGAETLYLRNYKINHCLGCFHCWLQTPGRCVQKDDMTEVLFDRYLQADLVVLASPIYHATMNARMKLFVERTLPMMDPLGDEPGCNGNAPKNIRRLTHWRFYDLQPQYRPPHRFANLPRIVTLSVGGYWDQSTFQALPLTWHMILGRDLIAEVYRHSAQFLTLPEFQEKAQAILEAVARAGEEVVRLGQVRPATMAALTQDLAPAETIIRLIREFCSQGAGG